MLELDHPDLDPLVPHTPDHNRFLDRVGRSDDFKPHPFLREIQRVPDDLLHTTNQKKTGERREQRGMSAGREEGELRGGTLTTLLAGVPRMCKRTVRMVVALAVGVAIHTLSVDRATAVVSGANDDVIEPNTLSSSATVIVCLAKQY